MKALFWVCQDSGHPGKEKWLVWSLLGKPGNDLLLVILSVNKTKLFTFGLHYLSRRPSSQSQQFPLIPTNQPRASHLLSLWDSATGSHSSGTNLSRLEHSAKGHYPGLHVCWAAVLSNSTRCRCDHWVTCKGKGSSCTSSFSSLLSNLHPFKSLGRQEKL